MSLQWLGTAGFALRAEGYTLLFDPYVTRASLSTCALSRVYSRFADIAWSVPQADAIVVGHTHFDHVLDVPAIALARGAVVYGSSSAAHLCRAAGVANARIVDVEAEVFARGSHRTEVGPFRLTFYPSVHSRFAFGRVPFAGEITDCESLPVRIGGYRCGAVFGVRIDVANRTLYHVGSADLLEGSMPPMEADVVMLCVAGWTATREYPARVLRALRPDTIVLSHWDDFFRPLIEPARALPAIGFSRLVDEISRAEPSVAIKTLDLLGSVEI